MSLRRASAACLIALAVCGALLLLTWPRPQAVPRLPGAPAPPPEGTPLAVELRGFQSGYGTLGLRLYRSERFADLAPLGEDPPASGPWRVRAPEAGKLFALLDRSGWCRQPHPRVDLSGIPPQHTFSLIVHCSASEQPRYFAADDRAIADPQLRRAHALTAAPLRRAADSLRAAPRGSG